MAFLMGFFRAIMGICETAPLDEGLWTPEGNRVMISLGEKPARIAVGGAARLEGRGLESPILIVRAGEDDYLAFENRCTHGGRRLDPVEGKAELRCCSVSHSRYDYAGNKLSGPAKGPLKTYAVEKRGEELIVSLGAGSGRGL